MKYAFRVRPQADVDLDEIAAYIARQSGVDRAMRFLDHAFEAFASIRSAPLRHPLCGFRSRLLRSVRKQAIPVFKNYYVFYIVQDDAVEVLRVMHGARNLSRRLIE
jgi:toxin ParE1/3/4